MSSSNQPAESEWSVVGWSAVPLDVFNQARNEVGELESDSNSKLPPLQSLFVLKTFSESPMQAIVNQRKKSARALGATLSDSGSALKTLLRKAPTQQVRDLMYMTNFVLFKLSTKVNIPEALDQEFLRLESLQQGHQYSLTEAVDPFFGFKSRCKNQSHADWKIDAQWLWYNDELFNFILF